MFFAIGFETTTPPTAVAILQAQAEGLTNFTVFCNHVLDCAGDEPHPRHDRRGRHREIRIDGFLGPSHVSSVIGSKPTRSSRRNMQAGRDRGFEPLDVMQSVLMLIRQVMRAAARSRTSTPRGDAAGQPEGPAAVSEVMEIRPTFEWRGSRARRGLGPAHPRRLCRIRRGEAICADGQGGARDQTCECPSILREAKKPTDCKLFRHHLHAGKPDPLLHGLVEGACAAYYSYGPLPPAGGGRVNAPAFSPARSPPQHRHDAWRRRQGGVQLVRGIFQRHFANPALDRGDDGAVLPRLLGTAGADLRRPCRLSPLFFPGGDIGSLSVHGTVNDLAVMGRCPWR